MRIAHLSDLHLGYRAFPRRERGGNLRERDVARAFHQAMQELGRLSPDLVLLAGDLFQNPDPPATAFLSLTRGIRRLQEALPQVPILAVAGAADTPAAPGDPGPVAVVDALPGVEAASGAPRAVHLRRLDAHVLLVPHRAVVRPPYPELRPDPKARWNLLLLRGHPGAPEHLHPLLLDAAGWDYVALGGGHAMRSWQPRVWTAGSLERIGADPWREAAVEKGFLLADLARGSVEFHPIPGRPVVDLAPIRVDAADPEAGTRRLRDLLEELPGGADGKLLRVRLRGDAPAPSRAVSPGLLAGLRRRAAHVEVVMEGVDPPPPLRVPSPPVPLPHLRWWTSGGRGEEVELLPGLWTLTADAPDDLELLARLLEGQEDPRLRIELSDPWPADPPEVPDEALPRSPHTSSEGDARARRADWIEAAGDAEARALAWARERQEADTRLVAYRDRARELRERIRDLRDQGLAASCPTCRRPLGEAHPNLLERLEEEWEEVVQDGTWWKRRRAQLEDKPADLLALERRALELQAHLDGDVHPDRVPSPPSGTEPGEARGRHHREGGSDAGSPAAPPAVPHLQRTGFLVQRATEGRLEGVVAEGSHRLLLVDAEGHVRPPTLAEHGLLALAREAAAALEPRSSAPLRIVLSGRAGVPPQALARVLEALTGTAPTCAWLAVVPPEVAATLPHRLRGTLEVVRDEDDRLRVRRLPGGRARVELSPDPD